MARLLEQIIARLCNRLFARPLAAREPGSLLLGQLVRDGQIAGQKITLPSAKRCQHVAITGRTGSGKTSLIKHLLTQDANAGRPFLVFAFHRELKLFCLRLFAALEQRRKEDLSGRLVVVSPADPQYAVGLELLQAPDPLRRFVHIAELVEILTLRWQLDKLGARTLEVLRNAAYVASAAGLSLLELRLLLTNPDFLAACLGRVDNPEIIEFFQTRYLPLSPAMQAVMREPILNRLSNFTADPHFRHILGQTQPAFSLLEALEEGLWVIVDLDKGRLGDEAGTLGALLLARLKNTVFARSQRTLFTVYADEFQNLLGSASSAETLVSEARKQGLGLLAAHQFADQLPLQTRHALDAIGTHVYFQLSPADAEKAAAALGGGRILAHRLRNLAPRQFVIKSGHAPWQEGLVPELVEPNSDFSDLYERCRRRWGRPRTEIEAEIRNRQQAVSGTKGNSHEILENWD